MTISQLDPQTRHVIEAFIARIEGQFDLKAAILFGSRARKDHHHYSDADLALLLRGHPDEFLTTKPAMADIAYEVLLETGVHIQPLPIWETEWRHTEEHTNPHLLYKIAREGIRF